MLTFLTEIVGHCSGFPDPKQPSQPLLLPSQLLSAFNMKNSLFLLIRLNPHPHFPKGENPTCIPEPRPCRQIQPGRTRISLTGMACSKNIWISRSAVQRELEQRWPGSVSPHNSDTALEPPGFFFPSRKVKCGEIIPELDFLTQTTS